MGTRIALNRAPALHDSNGWPVSLELSLAALFPSRTGDLRGGSLASKAGVADPGFSRAWTCRLDRRRSVDFPHSWRVRFSAHLDCYWTGCGLGLFGIFPTQFRFSIVDARRESRFAPSLPHISAFRRTVECHATIFLKNCLNLRRSIHSGFI